MKLDAGNAELFKGDNSSPLDRTGNTEHSGAINGTYDDFATTIDEFLKNTVTVASGIKLTISSNSIVEVAGQLSAGGGGCNAAGQTAGWYSRIALEDNSQIINNGTIYLYGYIDEASKNNDSDGIVINNKDIYMPFIMRDFRGGSIMAAVYYAVNTYKISPFNQFEFSNITVLTQTNYGGNVYGWANLYANLTNNHETVKIVGADTSSIIQLSNSYSYLTCKFDKATEIHKIDIHGGANTNKMSIDVGVEIETSKVYFPISWRFDITLKKTKDVEATYNFSQMFKMMPGAKLTIEEGTNVFIDELVVYTQFTDEIAYRKKEGGILGGLIGGSWSDYIYSVPKYQDRSTYAKVPATLTVNGKLTANVLAGYVYTTGDNAQLTINKNTEITAYEPHKISSDTLSSELDVVTSIPEKLKLKIYSNQNYVESGVGTYCSVDGSWMKINRKITYNLNGGTTSDSTVQDILLEKNTLTCELREFNITTTKENYIFAGWYLDEALTMPASGATVDNDVTVYAKWDIITYNINYIEKLETETGVTDVVTGAVEKLYPTFNNLTNSTFTKDGNELKIDNYIFIGYFLDENFTVKLEEIDGSMLKAGLSHGDTLNVYVKWISADAKLYTINYSNIKNSEAYGNAQCVTDISFYTFDLLSLPTFINADNDTSYQYYFKGWQDYNGNIVTSISKDLFAGLTGNNPTITLTAVWGTKASITITDNDYHGNTISSASTKYVVPLENYKIELNDWLSSMSYLLWEAVFTIDGVTTNYTKDNINYTCNLNDGSVVSISASYKKIIEIKALLKNNGSADYQNSYIEITNDGYFVNKNGSISKDNVVISEASSSNSPTMVYVLEGTNITFHATCKNDTSKKGSNSLETTYESKNFELTYSISVSGWLSKKYTLSYSKTEY